VGYFATGDYATSTIAVGLQYSGAFIVQDIFLASIDFVYVEFQNRRPTGMSTQVSLRATLGNVVFNDSNIPEYWNKYAATLQVPEVCLVPSYVTPNPSFIASYPCSLKFENTLSDPTEDRSVFLDDILVLEASAPSGQPTVQPSNAPTIIPTSAPYTPPHGELAPSLTIHTSTWRTGSLANHTHLHMENWLTR
jgi:hypothetical protein